MNNLKFFNNKQHYDSLKTNFKYPTVSWVNDEERAYYVENTIDYSQEYLTLTALANGRFTMTLPFGMGSSFVETMSYSFDKTNWNTTEVTTSSSSTSVKIEVSEGDVVYIKCKANSLGYGMSGSYSVNKDESFKISSTCNYDVSGNVMSLFYEDNFANKTMFPARNYNDFEMACPSLFRGSKTLLHAHNLILPVTTLGNYSYSRMFFNCSNLVTAPKILATTLGLCSCSQMFSGCSSLVQGPDLLSTTLAKGCYYAMFRNCSKLNYIKALFISDPMDSSFDSSLQDDMNDIDDITPTNYWVENVSSTGTFVKNSAATWTTTGVNGVPTGWTVETASA